MRASPLGPVVPYIFGGGWRWSARSGSTVSLTVGNQTQSETFEQDDSGVDPIFGGGVEFWFAPFAGVNAGVTTVRMTADSSNDDEGDVDERFTTFFVGLKLGRRQRNPFASSRLHDARSLITHMP